MLHLKTTLNLIIEVISLTSKLLRVFLTHVGILGDMPPGAVVGDLAECNGTLYIKYLGKFCYFVNVLLDTFYRDDNYLYTVGRKLSGVEYNDPAMYIFSSTLPLILEKNPLRVQDVTTIKKTLTINSKTFIDVNDIDRMTGAPRDVVLLFENGIVTNFVVGAKKQEWDDIHNTLIMTANETDINRNKLYTYDTSFSTVFNSYDVTFWSKVKEILFTCGKNNDKDKTELYKFKDANKVFVNENIEVSSMIDVKNNYFLIYGQDIDPKSPTNGEKVLSVYNEVTNKTSPFLSGIDILKMIQVP